MKKIMLLVTAAVTLAAGVQLAAQDAAPRDLKLMVRNSRGKVMRGGPVMVQIKGEGNQMSQLDRFGNASFSVTDADTLTLVAGSSIYEFPVAGYDSLQVVFRNRNRVAGYVADGGRKLVNTGYGTIARRDNTGSVGSLDMQGAESYSTLKEYIQGRVAGVSFMGDRLIIRGSTSVNSNPEALIVLDGSPMGNFAVVNEMIHPGSVAEISVLKDAAAASIYGARGGNGVVLITTKKGDN
jgi:TonB-dependent SusC/RagA subfamily outer membrane receptor